MSIADATQSFKNLSTRLCPNRKHLLLAMRKNLQMRWTSLYPPFLRTGPNLLPLDETHPRVAVKNIGCPRKVMGLLLLAHHPAFQHCPAQRLSLFQKCCVKGRAKRLCSFVSHFPATA